MWASRSSSSPGRSRRLIWLRLLLILIVALLAAYVLPSPWAFHMGGKFSLSGEWDGYGLVRATSGGRYLLFTHLRGGIVNNHGQAGCRLTGCDSLTGSAQLCARGGQHYTFALTGAVDGWYTTNGSRTTIHLAGGAPSALPHGWVITFHGTWRGAVLPLASTGNSFTAVVTPAGAITARPAASPGTALVTLRYGSQASFDQACHALTTGH